jgi:predicted amidohydrolase
VVLDGQLDLALARGREQPVEGRDRPALRHDPRYRADRVGQESRGGIDLTFIVWSEIVSPGGQVLTRLDDTNPGIGAAEIDLSEASDKKFNEFNDLLVDRRPEEYHSHR